jgi:lipopolysaccharide biosynthesis glycosyltransferase
LINFLYIFFRIMTIWAKEPIMIHYISAGDYWDQYFGKEREQFWYNALLDFWFSIFLRPKYLFISTLDHIWKSISINISAHQKTTCAITLGLRRFLLKMSSKIPFFIEPNLERIFQKYFCKCIQRPQNMIGR